MINAILATARKDLKLMIRDPAALAILFLMPLVFILVMSLAMANVFDPAAKGGVTLAVANEDEGRAGRELVGALGDSGGFRVVTEWEGKRLDRPAAERLIVERKQQVALIVPAGFSKNVEALLRGERGQSRELLLIADPALSEQVLGPVRGAVKGLAQQSVSRSMAAVGMDRMFRELSSGGMAVPDATQKDLKREAERSFSADAAFVTVREAPPQGMRVERKPNSVEQNVPGYTLFGVFFIAMQLAANILEEKRLGTFRRLLAAPLPRWAWLSGKLLAFLCINLAQIAVMFAVGRWLLPLFGAPTMSLGAHPEGLLLVSVAVSLAANSLGLLLAALARTPAQSNGLGLIVVITSAVLGGVMVPRFVMPGFMQSIGLLSPHTWGLMAYQDLLMRGVDLVAVLPQVGILLVFAAVFFATAVWRFKWD